MTAEAQFWSGLLGLLVLAALTVPPFARALSRVLSAHAEALTGACVEYGALFRRSLSAKDADGKEEEDGDTLPHLRDDELR